jgi:hypothetical protein
MVSKHYLALHIAALFLIGCAARDYTRGQTSVCEVHKIPMDKTKVPVRYYGLYPQSKHEEAMASARKTLFPHARDSVSFDRIGNKPDIAIIYVCPDCREALRVWELKYNATN